MYIRYKQAYNGFKIGELVMIPNLQGYILVKKGIAEEIPRVTPINDIVVAQYVLFDEDNNLKRLFKSLFVCNNNSPDNNTFIDLISREEIPTSKNNNERNTPIVDYQSIIPFREYFKEDIAYTDLEHGSYIDNRLLPKYYNKLHPELADDFIAEIK